MTKKHTLTMNYLKTNSELTKSNRTWNFINGKDLLGWAKLTVGCFYCRNGKEVEGKGIDPDYIYNGTQGEEYLTILFNKLFNLVRIIFKKT